MLKSGRHRCCALAGHNLLAARTSAYSAQRNLLLAMVSCKRSLPRRGAGCTALDSFADGPATFNNAPSAFFSDTSLQR